jgi:hypothetical protein
METDKLIKDNCFNRQEDADSALTSQNHPGSFSGEGSVLTSPPLTLALSPSGRLYLYAAQEGMEGLVSSALRDKIYSLFPVEGRLQTEDFKNGQNFEIGLLRLGIINFSDPLPESFLFWRTVAQLFIGEVCKVSGANEGLIDGLFQEKADHQPGIGFRLPFPEGDLTELMMQAPFMRGSEYLTLDCMERIWNGLSNALQEEIRPFGGKLQDYLSAHNAAWNQVGRICFHLAENKANHEHPFAFLATYATHPSTGSRAASSVQHLPLGRALKDYAGEHKRPLMLSLLIPVQKAAEQNDFIKGLVDSGAIFQPLAWTAKEAHAFLKSIPFIEAAGVLVRVPNWWIPKHPPRPQVTVAIGNAAASSVGLTALLDFNMAFSLPNGEELDEAELKSLLNSQEHLVQIKGQWVEVDGEKISHVLSHWHKVASQVRNDGLSFAEGLRLLAGSPGHNGISALPEDVAGWSKVMEGSWLQDILTRLRHPGQPSWGSVHDQKTGGVLQAILGRHLQASLRPYQYVGVQWLWWLYNLRLGGCLADDMGLGKTMQVLSLMLLAKHQDVDGLPPPTKKKVHLLILPASLLGNWQAELKRFAPTLKVWVAHRSGTALNGLMENNAEIHVSGKGILPGLVDGRPSSDVDVVMTTYGNVYRLPWIQEIPWDMVILDEAQSIKNPATKQTLAIKMLPCQVRFILTGTPVENRLLDLWSLFDFIAPGLLGSSKAFSNYGKKAIQQHGDERGEKHFYAAIRHLVSPYILRRLKSDKNIISDLPDKTELDAYCFLSKQQVALYQKSVEELERRLLKADDDIKRRGLVLSYLTRLKQICNHPDQWLGHGEYQEEDSGKFIRLRELCGSIAAKQEKVLIFTQFREIIPALQKILEGAFGCSGLVLHGQTAIKDRAKLVNAFQQDRGPPFFILSLKAGGTGLNLTHASHVIHFDRWWNPAVENQATDRAYRIGQKKNVLVHKFICQGTIEEKIDFLIKSKKTLAEDILAKGEETSFTEMSTTEIMKIVSLDIHRALGDA